MLSWVFEESLFRHFDFNLSTTHVAIMDIFNSDEEIEAKRADIVNTVSDRGLEFAEYLHEV